MLPSLSKPAILRRCHSKNVLSDTAILSLSDFERIKKNAKFLSKEEENNTQRVLDEQYDAKMSKARALKNKLMTIDNKPVNKYETSDAIQENTRSGNSVLFQAKRILDNNEDCVKEMSKFVLYAKTAAIREKQLAERKVIEDIFKKKEQKLDVMIELERLKEIKFQEEKEKYRKNQQKEGCLVIIDQIKEKDLERIREKEKVGKEGIAIVKQYIELEQEDKRIIEKKKIHEEQMVKEVESTNKYAAIIREKKKFEEKELDLKILKYHLEKEKKEEDEIAEKTKLREEKERETQRLREKQEREQDKQAELDALRAKRAYKEAEKKALIKEKEEVAIKRKLLDDLMVANEKQKIEKQLKNSEIAKKEQEEYYKIIKKNIAEIEDERRKEEDKRRTRYDHKSELRKQIKLKGDNELLIQKSILEDGKTLRHKLDDYKMRMEAIKQEKLKEIQNLNIDHKYINDLERYQIK